MRGWALIYASQTRDNNVAAQRLFEEALKFSKRVSWGGHNLLRIEPLTKEGLARIEASLG